MCAKTRADANQGPGTATAPSTRRSGRWQNLLRLAGSLALVAAVVPLTACNDSNAADDHSAAPKFVVDPAWPKQLPNKWIIGQVAGVAVDPDDNIWVLHRPRSNTPDELGAAQEPPRSECCFAAPPVLKFDPEGNVLDSWGGEGQGYDWPTVEHGIWADSSGNIWVGGNGATDRQILKFSPSGQFLLQIGKPSADPLDSSRTDILGRVASLTVDDEANEVYLADGYGNKRIIVYDAQNGQFKRLWGAYGNVPDDADPGPYDPAAPIAQQFRNPVHCVRISNDGHVYVCDRVNNRVQVFTKAGGFVSEFFVRPETRGNGSIWDLSFSKDFAQRYVVIVDGENNVIWTVDRHTGDVVDKQASRGRNAGQFHWVHQFGTDSNGNIYTGEVDTSKRLQKFLLQSN